MFLQIIQGKAADPGLLMAQGEVWNAELRPGATGYLGSTNGITDDGTAVTIVRFESAEAARANSARPEQSRWWASTEPGYAGDVVFHDCEQVDTMMGGGSDDAGFVQVMHGRAVDPAKLREVGKAMESSLQQMRPDVLGGVVGWHGDRRFTQVMYFRSEAEARASEASASASPEMADWGQMMDGPVEFLDLRRPMFS